MNLPQPGRNVSIGDRFADRNLLDLFLLRYDREQTRRAYRSDLIHFFKTDHITVDEALTVSFVDVNAHLVSMEDQPKPAKPSTRRRRISAIRMFFNWLKALGVVEQNPADSAVVRRIPMPAQERAVTVLTAEQARALLAATEDAGDSAVRDHTLLLTLLHLVLRRSEAAAMSFEDLRMSGAYWVLDLPHTKGGSDQWVKVPAHVVEAIRRMQQHYGLGSGPVWVSMSNRNLYERLSAHSIYRIVRQTAQRAGLDEEIGAHTMRHTGCTLALENGASIQQVQTHARHKHLQTTMGYIHQREKLRDSAADFIKL